MSQYIYKCMHCREEVLVEEASLGEKINCPLCDQLCRIPKFLKEHIDKPPEVIEPEVKNTINETLSSPSINTAPEEPAKVKERPSFQKNNFADRSVKPSRYSEEEIEAVKKDAGECLGAGVCALLLSLFVIYQFNSSAESFRTWAPIVWANDLFGPFIAQCLAPSITLLFFWRYFSLSIQAKHMKED